MFIVQSQEVAKQFANNLFTYIIDPLIVIFFILGLIYFFYGIFMFIMFKERKEEAIKTITYGIIGLFIISSTFTILHFINDLAGESVDIENSVSVSYS